MDAIRPLDKRCAVSLCITLTPAFFLKVLNPLTGNLPGEVVRDGGGHFVCMDVKYGLCRACLEIPVAGTQY